MVHYRVHGTGRSATIVGLQSSQECKRGKITRETQTEGEGSAIFDATFSSDCTLSLVGKGR